MQECLDLNVLQTSSGTGEWRVPTSTPGMFDLSVELPVDLQCSHCVLQWTYRASNNWGVCQDGSGALGCGKQEHFRACADITIGQGER